MRLPALLEDGVRTAVDRDQYRSRVAHVCTEDPKVALVVHPAHHDECRAVAEDGVEVGQLDVPGQQLALVLPLIPIAIPYLTARPELSIYGLFFALSLLNWKYLLLGFILFRVFDIWKPWPVRRLENLPGGWGIMADDWMAGIYAAILLRVALHLIRL